MDKKVKIFIIIITIIVVIIIKLYNYKKTIVSSDREVCEENNVKENNVKENNVKENIILSDQEIFAEIYIEENINFIKKYKIINNLLTNKECEDIISEGEEYASKYNWSKTRHEDYPTTDNEINNKWNCYSNLLYKLEPVKKQMANLFNIDINKIDLYEIFIVKYQLGNQIELKEHQDGNEFSFILSLNNNYEGGGTNFKHIEDTIKLPVGNCVIFCGQHKHQGIKITEGTRYILVGFYDYIFTNL